MGNDTMDRLINDRFDSGFVMLDDETFDYERDRLMEDIENGDFDPDEVPF